MMPTDEPNEPTARADAGAAEVVAIDGPAASGKSSVARELARRLGRRHINSGLMYRAATRAVLDAGIDPDDVPAIVELLGRARVGCRIDAAGRLEILIDGVVQGGLTADDVNAAVSRVAQVPEVRAVLVALQRALGTEAPCVMEGRDIGSVVFPDAPHKFYIDASEAVRQQRRAAQGLADSIAERDRKDSTRASSPLTIPEGAEVIDTSDLTIEEVVRRILEAMNDPGTPIAGPRTNHQ